MDQPISTYGAQDLMLWRQWKASPTEFNLTQLLKQVEPLINSQVRHWSGTISDSRLKIKARALAKDALETYDPAKGALSTHLTTRLQKLSREVYPYQNVARLPEHQQIKFKTYDGARVALEDSLGRMPSTDEMADELGWSVNAVNSYARQLRGDHVASEGVAQEFFKDDLADQMVLDYVYHDLLPQEKQLFECITGYRGHPIKSNMQIMTEMSLTQGQLSYLKRKLIAKIQDYQQRFGG